MCKGVQNRTDPIKNYKLNQFKPKLQKTAFSLDVFGSLFYSTAWFGLGFSFYEPKQTKPNRNIRKTLIKHMSPRSILIETQ